MSSSVPETPKNKPDRRTILCQHLSGFCRDRHLARSVLALALNRLDLGQLELLVEEVDDLFYGPVIDDVTKREG